MFMSRSNEGEYYDIYENNEELDENEDPLDAIERLRGTIGRGNCVYCGAKNAMVYEGNICFVCQQCSRSIHEDGYYMWAAGYGLTFEERLRILKLIVLERRTNI